MKTIRSPHSKLSVVVPIPGGSYRVQIEDHRATVPDNVANILLGYGEAHYTLLDAFDSIEEGTTILLIRDTGLGDVLLCTPLLRELHKRGAIVDFMCNTSNMWIFENNPYVRKVYPLERDTGRRHDWKVAIDLRSLVENIEKSGRKGHRVDLFAEYCDIKVEDRHLDYFLTSHEMTVGHRILLKARAEALSSSHLHQSQDVPPQVVMFVWTSSHYTRNWSDVKKREVLQALSSAGFMTIIIDGARLSLQNLPSMSVDLSGQLSLREIAALMKNCSAVLSPDTGLFHLAGALDMPTVTYFGPMAIEERHTHKFIRSLSTPEKCSLWPCRRYECRLNRDENNQPRCLGVPADRVVNALKEVIAEASSA